MFALFVIGKLTSIRIWRGIIAAAGDFRLSAIFAHFNLCALSAHHIFAAFIMLDLSPMMLISSMKRFGAGAACPSEGTTLANNR